MCGMQCNRFLRMFSFVNFLGVVFTVLFRMLPFVNLGELFFLYHFPRHCKCLRMLLCIRVDPVLPLIVDSMMNSPQMF